MIKTLDEVDKFAGNYYFTSQQTGIDNRCRERMIDRCIKNISNVRVLELGFMDGQWTDHFLEKGCQVTVVEGAQKNYDFGLNKYAGNNNVTMIHSLFEEFNAEKTYDVILAGGMLKHLDAPVAFLKKSRSWLAPNGFLIATTPNAKSLHRRVGVHMGMLNNLFDLSETDKKIGNLKHYDIDSFRTLLSLGNYKVKEIATAILKPVSSDKMSDWPDELLDALDEIAREIPDYGWYIYALCI